jgi:hypothetical protein
LAKVAALITEYEAKGWVTVAEANELETNLRTRSMFMSDIKKWLNIYRKRKGADNRHPERQRDLALRAAMKRNR